MSNKKPEMIGVDAITGTPIYRESPKYRECPKCKKHSVTGDAYHQGGVCRNCGWYNSWDD